MSMLPKNESNFFKMQSFNRLCFRQELRSLHSLPSMHRKLELYAAVELLRYIPRKGTQPESRLRTMIEFRGQEKFPNKLL